MPLAASKLLAESGECAAAIAAQAARLAPEHPYLLFRRNALARLCVLARNHPSLRARLERSLLPEATAGEARSLIKMKARRLIVTAFAALCADGPLAGRALAAARRALRELTTGASWNPRPVVKCFLDSAEIAVAVALTYDWLYDRLSREERGAVEGSLLHQVVEPALVALSDPALVWPRRRDNCALVSHAGILIAALALLPYHRDLALLLITRCVAAAREVFEAFAPDGAWPEGPSYWSLSVRYAGLMIAALESSLADSFGLATAPGFAETGDFALYLRGPGGEAFDFGDSVRRFDTAPLAWLAHRFRRPSDGWLAADYDGWHLPFSLIWADRPAMHPSSLDLPTGKVFEGCDLATFRNTWSCEESARPVFLAIKGGRAAASSPRPQDVLLHGHADAGSFVIDGARGRWAMDLGPDDYDLPGYFDHGEARRRGQRWGYYRTGTAGHNTLLIGGDSPVPDARAPVIASALERDCQWAVFDLSDAYGKRSGSIRRGAGLFGREVVIADEIGSPLSSDVLWRMHTSAEPEFVGDHTALLRMGGAHLFARIIEPSSARFALSLPPPPRAFPIVDRALLHGSPGPQTRSVAELPRCDDGTGGRGTGAPIRRLEVHWPQGARRLVVSLSPDREGSPPALQVAPLEEWLARRPLNERGRARGRRRRAAPSAARAYPLPATRRERACGRGARQ
jgi:Heparinase II/III-like protein